jgi:hypothetical protein
LVVAGGKQGCQSVLIFGWLERKKQKKDKEKNIIITISKMNPNQGRRLANNYLKLGRGGGPLQCRFDATNVLECNESNGEDCRRYFRTFRQCLMDEFCPGETFALKSCIEANKNKKDKANLRMMCKSKEAAVDKCMKPRMEVLK